MEKVYCSFCGKEITCDNLGVEGNKAWICQDCLKIYYDILGYRKVYGGEDNEKI